MDSGSVRRPRLTFRRRAGAALAFAATIAAALIGHAAESTTRAAWIPATALETPDAIRRALAGAVGAGAPAVIAAVPLYAEPGPDRFAEFVRQAHDQKLRVFASIDVDRAAVAGEVPAARDHVAYQHPDWLMVPRALAPEMLGLDARSPEYLGRLSRWTRANGVDGIYLSPVLDEAAAFVVATTTNVLKRYAVDGVQLDAARYPAGDFDFGRRTLDAFRRDIRPSLSAADRAQVDTDEAIDPFAYPNTFPEAWRMFRQLRVTRLMSQLRAAIRQARPDATVIAVVSGVADADLQEHLQDWRTWLGTRVVDGLAVRSGTVSTIVSDTEQLARLVETAPASGSR